jgi:hypothetical protein
MFMLVIIWLVVLKTSEIYKSKMPSPYTFDYSSIFKILVGVYMFCASLIRLSVNTKIFSVYGILLAGSSFLPIMYWYYGEEFRAWFDRNFQIKQICQTLIIAFFIIIELFRRPKDYQNGISGQKYIQSFQEIPSEVEIVQINQV